MRPWPRTEKPESADRHSQMAGVESFFRAEVLALVSTRKHPAQAAQPWGAVAGKGGGGDRGRGRWAGGQVRGFLPQ